MRANIKAGKLFPEPKSYTAAVERLKQVGIEMPKIEAQLVDPGRALSYTTVAEYDQWLFSAKAAFKLFQCEERLLLRWIDDNIRDRLYKAMQKMEVEVDYFEPEETKLMEDCDDYYGKWLPKPAEQQRRTS